ncbi:hypothetical protein CDV36_013847 [Fusarium kuroshium]|uniref:Uncharacterized protein n=2 Tax=Fusarium solani species complex TaxID=232080 RepID=A0A3M2RN08_9HYPO|nr:hypothetical protein CDV36_013847 [Fusarium kuroshium]RSL71021.1 hypothetical protein CEP51_012099 [Fusarium floridanum]
MRFRGSPMSSGRLFAFQYGLTDLEFPRTRGRMPPWPVSCSDRANRASPPEPRLLWNISRRLSPSCRAADL